MDVSANLQGNKGVWFILMVTDAFSHCAMTIPLKKKARVKVAWAMAIVLDKISTDYSSSDVASVLQASGTKNLCTESDDQKAFIFERFNRILRAKILRITTQNYPSKCLERLDSIV